MRLAALALAVLVLAALPAEAASRTLYLYFTHTKETIRVVYKKNGRYVPSALRELNHFLRDWRRNESTRMDPELFDLLWEVYRDVGAKGPIHVVSAYRSPTTNAMLRRRSSGVAKQSQHIAGKAIDFYIPGVPVAKVREVAFKKQVGGVGYYPTSGSPFVHLDTGRVRAWPRMSREHLVKLFPDGKTLHLPADGKPLARYAEARALEKQGKLASLDSGRGFGLSLFGGGDSVAVASVAPETGVVRPGSGGSEGTTVVAALLSRDTEGEAETALARAADESEPEAEDDEAEQRLFRLPSLGVGRLISRLRGKEPGPATEEAVATASASTALPGVAPAMAAEPTPGAVAAGAPPPAGPAAEPAGPSIVLAALPPAKPRRPPSRSRRTAGAEAGEAPAIGYAPAQTGSVADRSPALDALGATAALLPPDDPGGPALEGTGEGVPPAIGTGMTEALFAGLDGTRHFVAPNRRDPMLLSAEVSVKGEAFAELIAHDGTAALDGTSIALAADLIGKPERFGEQGTWARTDRFRGISIVVFARPRE